MQSEPEIVVDAANELGEGVVWSPAHREVQWTDIFGRHFWAYRPEDGQRQSWPLPDRLACFAPLGGRSLLAGFAGGLEVFDLESGARRQIAPIEPDRPTTRLTMVNWTAKAGSCSARWTRMRQAQSRSARSGATKPGPSRGRSFPGCAYRTRSPFRPTAGGCISPIRLKGASAATTMMSAAANYLASGRSPWLRARASRTDRRWTPTVVCGTPNGEAGGSCATRPLGEFDRVLPLPCSRVTCCAFGGANLDRLFVTSARTGLDAAALASEPYAGALFAFDVGVRGILDTPFLRFRSRLTSGLSAILYRPCEMRL